MKRKALITTGILLTFIVLYSFIFWLKLSLSTKLSFEATRQLYLSNYPSFLRNARFLTLLYIILNITAIICLFQSRHSFPKVAAVVRFLIILNIVMMTWQVFSLM